MHLGEQTRVCNAPGDFLDGYIPTITAVLAYVSHIFCNKCASFL